MSRTLEIVNAVRLGLDSLDIAAAESDKIWTETVKTKLCRIGKGFKFCVGANKGEVPETDRDYGEWLYDVTWLEYDGNFVTDAPLVAECEWGGLTDIDDDFQKLLLTRAEVRVMIFNGHQKPCTPEIVKHLARQASEFKRSGEEDAWLLSASERTDKNQKGWTFRYFAIEKEEAREL